MQTCSFCQIVADPASADVVLDEAHVLAFLDRRPLFAGHTLVIPKPHHATLMELPPALLTPLFEAVRRVSSAVEAAMAAQGIFVGINNRVSQSVPHLHVHVVPRNKGDGLKGFFWPRHPYRDESERALTRERITEALATIQPG